MGRWGFCGALSCERIEAGALQRARHRGGEVVAARAVLSGVARGKGTSARKGGRWDAQARRVEATRQEVARAGPPRQAGGADGRRREAEQASR